MKYATLSPHPIRLRVGVLFILAAGLSACAPALTPTPSAMSALQSAPATAPISRPTFVATRPVEPVVSARSSSTPIPRVSGLAARPSYDAYENLVVVNYTNPDGTIIATFDPQDQLHNNRVAWHWERMTSSERDQALKWIFDPSQMQYSRFENRESWVIQAVTQWMPRMTDFALPADSVITSHWQTDGPPMSQTTLYEALSRIKSLALIPERRACNYGHSQFGLIEYGGETILFTAPGWKTVSAETREIFTTVWTIKEAMVIYYPQSLGWTNSCPSETDHLKNEYYSTIWLVKAQQVLAEFVPGDKNYWEQKEIPFQLRTLATQAFPDCLPAAFPHPAFTPTAEPCFPIP